MLAALEVIFSGSFKIDFIHLGDTPSKNPPTF
jgi:hypothetical protein